MIAFIDDDLIAPANTTAPAAGKTPAPAAAANGTAAGGSAAPAVSPASAKQVKKDATKQRATATKKQHAEEAAKVTHVQADASNSSEATEALNAATKIHAKTQAGVKKAIAKEFKANKELSTSQGVERYAAMQLKAGKASRQRWKVESMRLNKFKDLNAESTHFQRQAELVHTKLANAEHQIDMAKAVIKFSKYKQEQALTNKDDATMSLSKAQHMNDVRLHQLRQRTADSYLVEAENANEHRFTWKAQKAEWKSQSAHKKLSRAAVVLTAATAARDEAVTKYGRKSDKYRHAENNFAQAEEASTRVKAAYKQYALKVAGASNPHGVTVETQGNKVVVTMPKGATKAGSNSSSVQVVDGQNAAVVAAKMAGQNAVKKVQSLFPVC